MGDQAPGQNSTDDLDINMKVNIKDLLSDTRKEVINSLHQITPARYNALLEIERQLLNLRSQYNEDYLIAGEIELLYYKIKSCQQKKPTYTEKDSGPFTVIVEKKSSDGRGLHPVDLGKKLFSLKISNISKITKKGFNRTGITFSSYIDANNLLLNEILMKEGLRSTKIFDN